MSKFANMLFNEMFEEFATKKNREQRIEVLRKYGQHNVWFREFLNYAFNPKIKFDIDTIPEFKPSIDPAGLTISNLNNEMRRLYIFIPGHPKRTGKLDPKREARILYTLLTSLYKDEAALLLGLFKKNLGIKYLTARLVKDAFPNMPFEVEEKKTTAGTKTNLEKVEEEEN